MNIKFFPLIGLTVTVFLGACAKPPGSIAPVAVSSSEYEHLSCKALQAELQKNALELKNAENAQRGHVAADSVGVFLVLIPPTAFTGDASDEVALNKGEDIALKRAIEQRCA